MKPSVFANLPMARVLSCAMAAAIAVSGYSFSTTVPAISLEQMTKEADEIVVGNVISEEAKIVGGHFETDYQVQVHDSLKSNSEISPGKTFTFTLAGGVLQEPPLTQYVMGSPYLFKGEEVFLFLQKGSGEQPEEPKSSRSTPSAKSNLGNTFKVMGWNQGRFSVVTRDQDGKKFVTRVNLENFGVTNGSDEMRQVMKAMAQGSIPTVNQPIVRPKDIAADTRSKDPLEFTGSDGKKIKVERNAQKAAALKEIRAGGKALPVQDFDEFKAQVQSIMSSGN